jgi:DNA-binding NarL/FixJ family response regulator
MLVAEAIAAGADGFILKEDSKAEILRGIGHLSRGEFFLSSGLDMDGIRDAMASLRITPREREILQQLVRGDSAMDIGQKLGIGQRTVETHRNSLMIKFGARNTMDLIRKATEAGF